MDNIVDDGGNDYYASLLQSGTRRAAANGSNYNKLNFDIAKNALYKTTIDFKEVPASVSQITLLQIGNSAGGLVKFRNVPIINPDGSFTVIPNSDRSPVNRQPANTNNPTPRRKVCLPVVGCL